MYYGLIIIALLACIVFFFHFLVVKDFIKKTKDTQGKIKIFWFWLSFIPVLGPVLYLLGGNYNNNETSGKYLFFLIILSAFLIELTTAPLFMDS